MAALADPALAALGWGLRELLTPAPTAALLLNARPGLQLPGGLHLHCQQSFRPLADALSQQGHALIAAGFDPHGQADPLPPDQACVLLLPPRQREALRAEAARALLSLGADGVLLAAQANELGAKSVEADLRALCPGLIVHSKHHCRVLLARAADIDRARCTEWSTLDAARPLNCAGLIQRPLRSAPGLFAVDRVDTGSALLIEHLPVHLGGAVADFGSGVGVLAAAALERCPGIESLDLFEADARAVALSLNNLADARIPVRAHCSDVAAGIGGRFDVVLSNPPFHVGSTGLPALGQAFLRSAAAALKPGGECWIVANAHLPYEGQLQQLFGEVRSIVVDSGFKLLRAIRPQPGPAKA